MQTSNHDNQANKSFNILFSGDKVILKRHGRYTQEFMWLKTPESIQDVLWESPLEPVSSEAVERLVRENKASGVILNSENLRSGLPIVSIGTPETWNLAELYPSDKLPKFLELKLNESDFYIVRFSCSFRIPPGGNNIEWARFIVQLYPGENGQPIAFDLHPLMVTQEVKHNVRVTLNPSIKFQEIGASLGGIDFGLEYLELHPIISAAGIGEGTPSWDYQEVKGSKIQGSKFMYMLLKVPKAMRPVEAFIDLIADSKIRDQILRLKVGRKEETAKSLNVQLVE